MSKEFSRRSDSTVEYQKKLDTFVNEFLTIHSFLDLQNFNHSQSFAILPSDRKLLMPLLQSAILKATNPNFPEAYCKEGFERHPNTFSESMELLADGIRSNQKITLTGFNEVVTVSDEKNILVTNLLVQGEKFTKPTKVPIPQIEANRLHNKQDKQLFRELRNIADERGKEFAVVAGIYAMLSPDQIFSALEMGKSSTDIEKNRLRKGNRHQILIALDDASRDMTTKTHPKYGMEYYKAGLTTLANCREFDASAFSSDHFELRTQLISFIPQAIFSSLEELMQYKADPRYKNPARDEYISAKSAKRYTTKMKTGGYQPV